MSEVKQCRVCGKTKNLSDFHPRKCSKDGYRSECKVCRKDIHHQEYVKDSERICARARKYRADHPEQKKLSDEAWRMANPDRVRATGRKAQAKQRKLHPEKIKAEYDRWRKENPEKMRSAVNRWRAENPEKAKRATKVWRSAHPENQRAWKVNRRYREKNGGKISGETIKLVYEDNIKRFGTLTCYLCLNPIPFAKDHLEHKTPLSRDGTNEYNNLGVSCQKCNLRKHTKTEKEYTRGKQ